MPNSWLDPLFLEMCYDKWLRDTPLVWPGFWQSLLWLMMGGLASLFLVRRPAHAHRILLLAGLATVVTPLLSVVVERLNWGYFRQPAADTPTVLFALAEATGSTADVQFIPAVVTRPFHLARPLLYCWLAVSLACLARLSLSMYRAGRLLARAKPLQDPALQQVLEGAASRLELAVTPGLYTSAQVRSPVICCWGKRPAVCLPEGAIPCLSQAEWVGIFCHELAHCKRRDHWGSLFAELMVVLFPWNPLAWRARSRLGFMAERVCDEWVLRTGQPAADYSEALLKLVPQGKSTLALAAVSSSEGLRARIRAILRQRRLHPRVSGMWSAMTGVATVVCIVLIAFAQASTERPALPAEDGIISVSGRVLDTKDRPIAGATVVMIGSPWFYSCGRKLSLQVGYELLSQTKSDSAGSIQLSYSPKPTDEYARQAQALKGVADCDGPRPVVFAAAPGYGLSQQLINPGEPIPKLNIHLSSEEVFSGRLIDLQGQPVADVRIGVRRIGKHTPHVRDARVKFFLVAAYVDGFDEMDFAGSTAFWEAPVELPGWPEAVRSDANGRFTLHGIAREQEFELLVGDDHSGYQALIVEPRKREQNSTILTQSPRRFLEGRVTDAETGEPIAQALVYARPNYYGRRGSGGTEDEHITSDWMGRRTIEMGDSDLPMPVAAALWRGERYIAVRQAVVGTPVRTDIRGRFQLPLADAEVTGFLPPRNKVLIRIQGPPNQSYLEVVKEISWPSSDAVRATVEIGMPRGVLVRGHVRDEQSGMPVPGTRVDFWSKGFRTPSDVLYPRPLKVGADGVFEVVLPPARWHILVNGVRVGYQAEKVEFADLDEPIAVGELTSAPQLLKPVDQWPLPVAFRDQGYPLRYHPRGWVALDVARGDKPKEVRIMLRPKSREVPLVSVLHP